ncbi:hypothetical protein EGW08_008994, partial [Elysia chlorotica]
MLVSGPVHNIVYIALTLDASKQHKRDPKLKLLPLGRVASVSMMECLVDDTTNCNLPAPGLCSRCGSDGSDGPVSSLNSVQSSEDNATLCITCLDNDRSSDSYSDSDNRLANTNNNVCDNSSSPHILTTNSSSSNSSNNISSCRRCHNAIHVSATVAQHVATSPATADTVTTQAGRTATQSHTAPQSCSCSGANQHRAGTETAANRRKSHSTPLGTPDCKNCTTCSNGGVHCATSGTCNTCNYQRGVGGRLSLESYLIPDPDARAELEQRLRAYSRAAGQDKPSGHGPASLGGGDGLSHLSGDIAAKGNPKCSSFLHCTPTPPQPSIPLNLNLCHDENSCRGLDNSQSSHHTSVGRDSNPNPSPPVPKVLVTSLSGGTSVLDLSGATDASSPTNPVRDSVQPHPQSHHPSDTGSAHLIRESRASELHPQSQYSQPKSG